MSSTACDPCLRRTALVAALAGHIECARRDWRSSTALLALPDAELVAAVGARGRADIHRIRAGFDSEAARRSADRAGLGCLCRHHPCYPQALLDAPDPPAVLHHTGAAETLACLVGAPAVAIVGARRASEYGLEVARSLARDLAVAEVTVVSGMALGIDATAHQGALDRGGGTVAVLAGGADVPYPASRRPLYRRIVGTGCVVSELPPGFRAHKWCFPARNRIIAGLAQLTIVVEAASRSGSLITAGIARDLGREVGAVPGRVTSPVAAGTNELLADGARLIRDAGDVLDALYGVGARPTRSAAPDPGAGLPPALRSLLAAVGDGCDTLGALVARGLDLEAALSGLAELEVQGRLRRGLGGRYVVAS